MSETLVGVTLFEMSAGLAQLVDMMGSMDPEEQQVFNDTLEAVKGEIGMKIDSWYYVMQLKGADADKLEEMGKKLIEKAKAERRDIDRMKDTVFSVVDQVPADKKGRKRIEGEAYTASIRNNGGPLPIVYTGDVPPAYLKVVRYGNDTEKIRKALDKGEKLDFCHYGERGRHLQIK